MLVHMEGKRQEISGTQQVHLCWSPFRMKKAIGSSESNVKPLASCQSCTEMQQVEGRDLSRGTHIALPQKMTLTSSFYWKGHFGEKHTKTPRKQLAVNV